MSSLIALLVDSAVSSDFCVYVSTLALVKVDLHLDVFDLPCLLFELRLKLQLERLHLPFLLVVLVHEDSLICVIELLVFLLLCLRHFANHI